MIQMKNINILWRQCALLLVLLVCGNVYALNVVIKENKIFVDGKVPLGIHPDARYFQALGQASHRNENGDMVWTKQGVVLKRRGDDPNCMVIAQSYLKHEYGSGGMRVYIHEIEPVNKPVLVEGVPLTSETGLREVKAVTAKWAEFCNIKNTMFKVSIVLCGKGEV